MSIESGQAGALYLMFCVGLIGLIPYIGESSLRVRIVGGVWVVFWSAPALALLWIKGVFG